jgi:hypothetical protein
LTYAPDDSIVRIMKWDITRLLEAWDYRPGEVAVRRIKGKDGLEKIQLRVDLGLLQMNAEGRPDGKRPMGKTSLLEHFQSMVEKAPQDPDDEQTSFELSAEDISRLQQEAIQYHHRYICLFQLEDFDAVIRDTERNLEAFDFADDFAASDELAWSMQQFRPQTLMMRARAQATVLLKDGRHGEAAHCVENAVAEIRQFYLDWEENAQLESSGEIQSLELWLAELRAQRPLTEKEKLVRSLHDAVAREDYEKAARVRDALRNLGPD